MQNEESNIDGAIRSAKTCKRCEVIVVDGGSNDATIRVAQRSGATVVRSPRGRGRQLNAGAEKARGDIILFLHADSRLPDDWENMVEEAMSGSSRCTQSRQWGCFETINIDAHPVASWLLRQSVCLRTHVFHRPYGDQGIFVTKTTFRRSGGYPDWPLLEDLALVQHLRRHHGPPAIVHQPMATSGRRWKSLGLLKTTMINQAILIGYSMGTDVYKLADWYHGTTTTGPSSIFSDK